MCPPADGATGWQVSVGGDPYINGAGDALDVTGSGRILSRLEPSAECLLVCIRAAGPMAVDAAMVGRQHNRFIPGGTRHTFLTHLISVLYATVT